MSYSRCSASAQNMQYITAWATAGVVRQLRTCNILRHELQHVWWVSSEHTNLDYAIYYGMSYSRCRESAQNTQTWTTCFSGSLKDGLVHAADPVGLWTVLVGTAEERTYRAGDGTWISAIHHQAHVLRYYGWLKTVLQLRRQKESITRSAVEIYSLMRCIMKCAILCIKILTTKFYQTSIFDWLRSNNKEWITCSFV